MDAKQVNDALDKLFQQQRIIFWNDPDREFVGSKEEIQNKLTTDNTECTDNKIQPENDIYHERHQIHEKNQQGLIFVWFGYFVVPH